VRKIGILYDNISGNIGDVAIGLSVKKILRNMQIEFEELVPGRFNPNDYETIIIGGGNLIRPSPNFFYDKFRIPGNHILNSCGIAGFPDDLHFLDDYRYVSVRSTADRRKLHYLKREVKIVPCTSMLLDELKSFSLPIEKPSIGIHLMPGFIRREDEEDFVEWVSSLGLNAYFLPVTHYNLDFVYLNRLSSKVRGSKMIPLLKAQEIFTIIGKFNYFISSSLHGAIFSYVHNVPFIVLDRQKDKKMRFFMEDRGLGQYLFADIHGLKSSFEGLLKDPPDYSEKVSKDFQVLDKHIKDLENILAQIRPRGFSVSVEDVRKEDEDLIQQLNAQVHFLQLHTMKLNAEISRLENEIQKIRESITWRILRKYDGLLGKLLPKGTRRRRSYDWILHAVRTILTRSQEV